MTNFNVNLQYIGYGLAGLVYLVLAILLLTNFRGRLRGVLLTAVAVISTVWAFLLAWGAHTAGLSSAQLFFIEMGHDAVWLVFLSALLSGAIGTRQYWAARYGGIVLVGGILALGSPRIARQPPRRAATPARPHRAPLRCGQKTDGAFQD